MNLPKTKNAKDHLSYRNYARDVVLGANDALVSIFALVIGVLGSGFGSLEIFLAGISGAIAGAISMAIGEYMSTKSQEQIYDAEKKREQEHIKHFFEEEKKELREMYSSKGFSGEILDKIVETIASNPRIMLKVMLEEEFGIKEEERRNPFVAMGVVFVSFLLASMIPVIPFAFISNVTFAGIIVSGLTLSGLFVIGSIKSYIAEANWFLGGMENVLLGTIAGLITFVIGNTLSPTSFI